MPQPSIRPKSASTWLTTYSSKACISQYVSGTHIHACSFCAKQSTVFGLHTVCREAGTSNSDIHNDSDNDLPAAGSSWSVTCGTAWSMTCTHIVQESQIVLYKSWCCVSISISMHHLSRRSTRKVTGGLPAALLLIWSCACISSEQLNIATCFFNCYWSQFLLT